MLKDDIEPRKTSREVLTRNYCKSCKASVCNDVANDEGKLQRRVSLVVYGIPISLRPLPS